MVSISESPSGKCSAAVLPATKRTGVPNLQPDAGSTPALSIIAFLLFCVHAEVNDDHRPRPLPPPRLRLPVDFRCRCALLVLCVPRSRVPHVISSSGEFVLAVDERQTWLGGTTSAPLLLLVRLSRARLANRPGRSFFALAAARAGGLTVDARRRRGPCGIVMELIIKFSIVVGMTLGNRRRYERSTLPISGDATVSLADPRDALLLGLQLPKHRCPLAALLLQLVTALSWYCAGTRSRSLPGSAHRTQWPSSCGR